MVVVSKLHPGCPLLLIKGDIEQVIVGHISVPLITKERMVGQLNIAYNDPEQVNQLDADLLKTIAPQLAVAIENARLWEEVQNKEAMRRELLKKVVTAQEEERKRISRELHDELGQQLTSLLVQFRLLENRGCPAEVKAIYDTQMETVSGMLSGIHDLAVELRPAALDDLGLVPALEQYFKDCPARLGVKVDFAVVGLNGERLPREIETTLYRVIQESLTNVARHARVNQAGVLLKKNGTEIIAIVEDNGVGFDVKETTGHTSRLGIYGIEERVALTGGTLTIESRPGGGTTMYVKIPL
jgi:signal transduction histidine kinase